jgi:hypothetical protein
VSEISFGPIGWSLAQAQGTTGTYASGTIVDLAGTVTNAYGDTAATPSRVGGALDNLLTNANPKLVMYAKGVHIDVSALVDFSADAAAVVAPITSDFLSELERKLVVFHKEAGGIERNYSVRGAVGTILDNGALASNDTAQGIANRTRGWAQLGDASGIEVDLENDQFTLAALAAINLPAGQTIQLTAWFDGVAVMKSVLTANNDKECKVVTAGQLQSLAQAQNLQALRPMT